MILTFKYRLFPSKSQRRALEATLSACRLLYNTALCERRDAWKKQNISVSYYDQAPQLKHNLLFETTGVRVYSQVQQNVLRRCDMAFQSFYRRCKRGKTAGYPRFQGYRRYNSFTYPQSGFSVSDDNRVSLSGIGSVHCKMHRSMHGTIKTLTITREDDKWFACFACEVATTSKAIHRDRVIALDVGLEKFITDNQCDTIDNPRLYRKAEKKLARVQRRLQRCCSRKNHKAVRRAYRAIRNKRNDFLHKITTSIIKKYDVICVENLSIKQMIATAPTSLRKSIYDAGWGRFFDMLRYKAEWAGSQLIEVPPQYTSQTCPSCGVVRKKKLSERKHCCPDCGYTTTRDHAASQVIMGRGLASLDSG